MIVPKRTQSMWKIWEVLTGAERVSEPLFLHLLLSPLSHPVVIHVLSNDKTVLCKASSVCAVCTEMRKLHFMMISECYSFHQGVVHCFLFVGCKVFSNEAIRFIIYITAWIILVSSRTEGQGSLLLCTLWSDFILFIRVDKADKGKQQRHLSQEPYRPGQSCPLLEY